MTETINGIPVEITRKRIKTLRITVRREGAVKVSAPFFLGSDTIRNFVTAKTSWIKKQQERAKSLSRDTLHDNGEAYLWGVAYPITITQGQRAKCELSGGMFIFSLPPASDEKSLTLLLEAFYKKELTRQIKARLPLFEALTGLKCASWSIRKMSSHWGSCTTLTKAIRFSLNLAKHPPECLDYVILHELLHILYPNHGRQFKADLTRYCPDWQNIRKKLNNRK